MTAEWTLLAIQRHTDFKSNIDAMRNKYGKKAADDALNLYEGIAALFADGVIMGVRLVGKKK